MLMAPKRQIKAYAFVWALAFAARAIYLWQIRSAPIFTHLLGDAAGYDAWATRIAGGDWVGQAVFYQAPLYPYFLGVLYALIGRNLLAIRILQVAIGATSCVLLARAGRSFFSRNCGILAGIILALYPTAIFFDCSIQKSVLDLFFTCALLAICGRLSEQTEQRWWGMASAVLGLFTLTRENALVLFPMMLVWLLAGWRHESWATKLRSVGLLTAGMGIVLLPVACRNFAIGGEFHLTTAQFGPNFYIGNGKDATGGYVPLRWGRGRVEFEREDATALAERAAGRKLTPGGVSHSWTARALADMREEPVRWLRLMGRKWLLVWNVSELGDSEDQYTPGDWSSLLRWLNRVLHFGTLCPLAALGICMTWENRRRLWPLYLMLLGYAASVALFYVFSRYRFPLAPILVVFAAAGLTRLRDIMREPRGYPVWTGLATAALLAVVCNRPMAPEAAIRATTYNNLGMALRRDGKFEGAIDLYQQALRLAPDFVEAHLNLAGVFSRVGKQQDAIAECQQALRLKPDQPDAHYNLAIELELAGRPREAIEHYEQAIRLRPEFVEAHDNLGSALIKLGNVQEAKGEYERALRINPDYAKALCNLGSVLQGEGKLDEAVAYYQHALRIKPGLAEAHYNLARTFEKMGQPGEAIDHYEQALNLRPDLTAASNALLRLRAAQPAR